MCKTILSSLLFILFVVTIASSQEAVVDSQKIYQLKEIVVTVTRFEKNAADVGRSITLVPSERNKSQLYHSVGEVLTQQEGIYVVGAGQNSGMLQSIFMRGASSNHTAILIDDIPITDPSAVNRALDVSEVSFAGFDRIEIVRGLHSTLYGTSAIGGVVNMITRKNGLPGFHADAELRTGAFGKGTSLFAQTLSLNYTHPIGLYGNVDVENSNVKGLDATVDTVTNSAVFKNRDQDDYDKQDVLGKIGLRNEKLDIYVSYKNTQQATDIDKRAYVDDDNYILDFKRNLVAYGGSYAPSNRLALKYIGGFSEMERSAVDDSSIVDRAGNTDRTYYDARWKGTTLTNELQAFIRIPHIEGILGVGTNKETMTSQSYFYTNSIFGVFESRTDLDTLNPKSTTTNIFSHLDFRGSLLHASLDRLSFGLGMRYNHHSTYGDNITYELNPSYRVTDDVLLYASYSTGFNAPSLYQLFAPDKHYISRISRGNPNLEPEEAKSFEFGIKQSVGRLLSLGLAYYNTMVDNAISYVYLWDKNIGIDTLGNDWMRDDFRGDTYLNLGRQTSRGIELTVNSRLSDQIVVAANLNFLSGKLEYKPSDITTSQTNGNHVQIYDNGAFVTREIQSLGLVRRPNTFNLSVTYTPVSQLTLRMDFRHIGARNDVYYDSQLGPYGALGSVAVADYTLIDFTPTFHINEHLTVIGRIENVFDAKYREINGFTTRGRGFYVKTRVSL